MSAPFKPTQPPNRAYPKQGVHAPGNLKPTYPVGHTPGQPVGGSKILKRKPGESAQAWDLRRQTELAKYPPLTPAQYAKALDKNNYRLDAARNEYERISNNPPEIPLTPAERIEALCARVNVGMNHAEVETVRGAIKAAIAQASAPPKPAPVHTTTTHPASPRAKQLSAFEFSRLSPPEKAQYVYVPSSDAYVRTV